MNNVIINGVEYAPVLAQTERRIVIAQRGWVYVGIWNEDGDDITLTDAKCIRIWGTKNGLGELCNGPLPDTKLDYIGVVRLHRLSIVASLDVTDGVW